MRLKQLTLHNIASIEDARIDFEAAPLVDSEVFLIAGKTGSGKSTLLDAICLALYDDTPRMRNLKMEGRFEEIKDSLSIKDPRQLMRQHTGEAYVKLCFEGSDGVDYEAQWSVARARKKPGGKLQDRQWTLTNLRTGKQLTRVQEVRNAIQAAVGLDFGQFCRTTLLAQGEFTRFLNSNDNEKAIILEKITGMEAYARIGQKIYELTRQKERAYEEKKQAIAAIQLLSPEELAEQQQLLSRLDEEIGLLQNQRIETVRKQNWLQQAHLLSQKQQQAEKRLEEVVRQMESADFREQAQVVSDWRATQEIRAVWREWQRCEERVKRGRQELQTKQTDYLCLLQGLLDLRQGLERMEKEWADLRKSLQQAQEKEPVYAKVQTIAERIRQWGRSQQMVDRLRLAIQQEEKRQTQLQAQWQLAQEQVTQTCEHWEEVRQVLELQSAHLSELNLPGLRETKDQLAQKMWLLNEAKHHLQAWLEAKQQVLAHERELAEMRQKQVVLLQEQALREQLYVESKSFAASCRQAWEAQQRSVSQWAKEMRSQLRVGDSCPVCGQLIPESLPQEEMLDQAFGAVEQQLQASQRVVDQQQEKYARAKSACEVQQEQLSRMERALRQEREQLQDKAERCEAACLRCRIEQVDERTIVTLTTYEQQIFEKQQVTMQRIKEAEQFEREVVDRLRQQLEQALRARESAQQHWMSSEKERSSLINSLENHRKQQEEQQLQMVATAETVDELLAVMPAEVRMWQSSPDRFVRELSEEATRYVKQQETERQVSQEREHIQTLLDNILIVQQEVWRCQPTWQSLSVDRPKAMRQPLVAWNQFYAMLRSVMDQLMRDQEQQSQLRQQLLDYVGNHPDYGLKRLEVLEHYAAATITSWERVAEEAQRTKVEREAALRQIQVDRKALDGQKPPMTVEEEQSGFLSSLIFQLDQQLSARNVQKGAIQQRMRQNEENRTNQSRLLEEAERCQTTYQQWNRLNELLGSADGKVFRKIAQSYVLGNLIHSANHYLQLLTNRYLLRVVPGTFIISLEDAYQGYTRRMASTLSGGESFLVSLSLALALADIASDLKVNTLFIDEGFGSLSGEHLQQAIQTLRMLHQHNHRQVGIISHVEELRARIPVQIQVQQEGHSSSSRVEIVTL